MCGEGAVTRGGRDTKRCRAPFASPPIRGKCSPFLLPFLRMPRRRCRSLESMSLVASVLGVFAALVVLELGLRPLATADLPPLARPAADRLAAPVITSRQLEEGIAEAHFSSGGARLTGNTVVAGGPVIVILGDSHVMAREISDEQTMGAWVE